MSICWGLSDPPPFSHGWKREEEFTVIRAPHWPCIDHFRFDFMRLATVTVGENVPFYRWHGRNFRIHDTFFFPFFTSINFVPQHEGMIEKRNARCVCEGKILSFLSPLFLVRRRGAIRGLWKIKYPRRGLIFTCVRVSNLILNLQAPNILKHNIEREKHILSLIITNYNFKRMSKNSS